MNWNRWKGHRRMWLNMGDDLKERMSLVSSDAVICTRFTVTRLQITELLHWTSNISTTPPEDSDSTVKRAHLTLIYIYIFLFSYLDCYFYFICFFVCENIEINRKWSKKIRKKFIWSRTTAPECIPSHPKGKNSYLVFLYIFYIKYI